MHSRAKYFEAKFMNIIDDVYGNKLRVHTNGVKYRGLTGLEALGTGFHSGILSCASAQLETSNPEIARAYRIGGEIAYIWFRLGSNYEDRRKAKRAGQPRRVFTPW